MIWSQAAARLKGFDFGFDYARDIEYRATTIEGDVYSIFSYRRGDEIIYCRACERDPVLFCLLSSDRSELEKS